MNEHEYKPNSHRSKAEQSEKKVEKVVNGSVKSKKRSEVDKLADIFVSEDIRNVRDYILMDVLVPALKKAISDVVTNGVDMILYGETKAKKSSGASRISYRDYYAKDDSRASSSVHRGYSFDEIILESRSDAEDVLFEMDALIENYGVVSVADLYDLVGILGSHTDNKYGWTNLRSAQVVRVRNGYLLKLPKAVPLN